jgi:hypothetical protein
MKMLAPAKKETSFMNEICLPAKDSIMPRQNPNNPIHRPSKAKAKIKPSNLV